MKNLKIEYIETEKLIPYINNPRINENAVDVVAGSIKEFGFKNPIIVDKDNVIIAGHTRLLASRKLGINTVPIIRAEDLTQEQVKAFRIADNKTGEFAQWDLDKLKLEFEALQELDFNLEQTGFSFDEIESLFDDDCDVKEDDYDIVLPKEPNARLGDVYKLGRHRLVCGDSTQHTYVDVLMDGNKADMYLTDPPYNVDYEGSTKDKLKIINDKMSSEEFKTFLLDAFQCADNVMKKGAVFYIWHADTGGHHFRSACVESGWKVRQCLIWVKNSMVLGRQDYHWQHEPCLYGWKSGAPHLWASDRKQTTILEFDKPNRNKEHPTMKPVLMLDYLIRNNTKPEDIVLDTFVGSGSTLIACEQNGRNAYCMELDPKYVDVTIDRWEQLTGQKAELISQLP